MLPLKSSTSVDPLIKNEFYDKKDHILVLLDTFISATTPSEKSIHLHAIRDLCSTLQAASTHLDKTTRDQEFEAVLHQVFQTILKNIPFLIEEPCEQQLLSFAKHTITWMNANKRSELPHVLQILMQNFLYTRSSRACVTFFNDLHRIKELPKPIASAINESTIKTIFPTFETEILETFTQAPAIELTQIGAHHASTVGQCIFSFLSTKDTVALMQTSKDWKRIGEEYFSSSIPEGLRYVKIIAHKQFSIQTVPSAFKKNIVMGTLSLITNIHTYTILDPELQRDLRLLKIMAFSHALKDNHKGADLCIKQMPQDFQKKISIILQNLEKTSLPKTPLWAAFSPFMLAGSPLLFPILQNFLTPTVYSRFGLAKLSKADLYLPDFLKKDSEYQNLMLTLFGKKIFQTHPTLALDEDFFKKAVRIDGEIFAYGDATQRADFHIAFDAVRQNGTAYYHIASPLKQNKILALEAARAGTLDLQTCEKTIADDDEIVLTLLKTVATPDKTADILQYASQRLLHCKNFMQKAIQINSLSLQHASDEIKDDPDIVLAAIKKNSFNFTFASHRLQTDFNFIEKAVQINGYVLQYTCPEAKDNVRIVQKAIEQSPQALKFASDRLKNHREIVMYAVSKQLSTFEHASAALRDDISIATAALKKDPYSFSHASDRLRDTEEFVLLSIINVPENLKYASDRLKNNWPFILDVIQQQEKCIKFVGTQLRKNRNFILEAVKRNPQTLQHIDPEFQDDESIVFEAIKQNKNLILFASDRVQKQLTVDTPPQYNPQSSTVASIVRLFLSLFK